jgi:polyphosphate glucokinase
MEIAHLPYKQGKTYEDYLGVRGLKRLGRKRWERQVAKVVGILREALQTEEVLLGGGNVKKLKKLPPGTRLGSNQNAFRGGFELWNEDMVHPKPRS